MKIIKRTAGLADLARWRNPRSIILAFILISLTLSACSGFFEKDNTPLPRPLTNYKAELFPRLMWTTRAGRGVSDDYLKLQPTVSDNAVFTASNRGIITAINKITGYIIWQVDISAPIATGPAVGEGLVVVASYKGDIIALQEIDGKSLWKINVPSEILAKPAIANGKIIVKSVDGYVRAFALDGTEVWSFQQAEPNLVLRGASSPVIQDGSVFVGFANGSLAKLSLKTGNQAWMQRIAEPRGAFSVQRMIDIDADPVVYQHQIYAATYQGKIASLDWANGLILWANDISSYTGMVIARDTLYISDASSRVWSFDANSGSILWRQDCLEFRNITAPALIEDYLAVGDGQGYVHWLARSDGHLVARLATGGAIYAAPVENNGILYVMNKNGYLSAYRLH